MGAVLVGRLCVEWQNRFGEAVIDSGDSPLSMFEDGHGTMQQVIHQLGIDSRFVIEGKS